MSGYSGTPLAKKLGIKEDFRIALVRVPADVKTEIQDALAKCRIRKLTDKNLDFVFLFASSCADLESELLCAAQSLPPAGMLWISWPKKSSGVPTDLTENIIRDSGLAVGLVDIKVCAVNDIWSGLSSSFPSRIGPKHRNSNIGTAALERPVRGSFVY